MNLIARPSSLDQTHHPELSTKEAKTMKTLLGVPIVAVILSVVCIDRQAGYCGGPDTAVVPPAATRAATPPASSSATR